MSTRKTMMLKAASQPKMINRLVSIRRPRRNAVQRTELMSRGPFRESAGQSKNSPRGTARTPALRAPDSRVPFRAQAGRALQTRGRSAIDEPFHSVTSIPQQMRGILLCIQRFMQRSANRFSFGRTHGEHDDRMRVEDCFRRYRYTPRRQVWRPYRGDAPPRQRPPDARLRLGFEQFAAGKN